MNVSDVLSKMPTPGNWRRVRFRDGSNQNIVSTIEKNLPEAIRITRKAAILFKGKNDVETCENIWKFIKGHITYKADGVRSQDVRLPNRLLSEGVGDCKSFSLFTAAILCNLSIPVSFRYVSFKKNPTPTHVYCVGRDQRGREIIVDAVYDKFNEQHSFTFKRDEPVKMEIAVMGAIDKNYDRDELIRRRNILRDRLNVLPVESSLRNPILAQIRKINSVLQTDLDGVAGGVFDVGKTIFLAPGRNAFLGLIAINVHKFASNLAAAIAKDQKRVKDKWEKLGGNYNSLLSAVNKGKYKNPILGFQGVGVLPAVAAALAAAAPVIVALGDLLKSLVPTSATAVDTAYNALIAAGGVLSDPTTNPDLTVGDDESKGFFSAVPWWVWLIGAGGVGYLVLSD